MRVWRSIGVPSVLLRKIAAHFAIVQRLTTRVLCAVGDGTVLLAWSMHGGVAELVRRGGVGAVSRRRRGGCCRTRRCCRGIR